MKGGKVLFLFTLDEVDFRVYFRFNDVKIEFWFGDYFMRFSKLCRLADSLAPCCLWFLDVVK